MWSEIIVSERLTEHSKYINAWCNHLSMYVRILVVVLVHTYFCLDHMIASGQQRSLFVTPKLPQSGSIVGSFHLAAWSHRVPLLRCHAIVGPNLAELDGGSRRMRWECWQIMTNYMPPIICAYVCTTMVIYEQRDQVFRRVYDWVSEFVRILGKFQSILHFRWHTADSWVLIWGVKSFPLITPTFEGPSPPEK